VLLVLAVLYDALNYALVAWSAGDLVGFLSRGLAFLGQSLVVLSPVLVVVLVAYFAGGAYARRPRFLPPSLRRRGWFPRIPAAPLVAADVGGLELLEPGPGEFVPDCPVCGVALGGQVRRCPRCDAPYHPDCWDYHGGCATYGCRDE
jgi:hypothetical protein